MSFGEHRGKAMEIVFLKTPDYYVWCKAVETPYGGMKAFLKHAEKLVRKFNAMGFNKMCHGVPHKARCDKPATRAVVYRNNLTPTWWCDECPPYSTGAPSGNLQEIRTFSDIVEHVQMYCRGNRSAYRRLVRTIAEAKGLPKRVGEKQAKAFFK